MVLQFLKRRRQRNDETATLYEQIVAEARRPDYFTVMRVPDTVDGRFDMLAAIVYLVLRRYRGTGRDTEGQALFDMMFHDMDQSLREMGAGDLGVAPRVKNMAKAFFGRVKAYDEGLDADDPTVLDEALRRNLYRLSEPEEPAVAAMAARMRAVDAALAAQRPEDIVIGRIAFPDMEGAKA
ncbi:MAG: hypothetical protein NXI16_03060 [Alphaproteobacteria bacterium]|nr:hypothetical protein [Alphaproteobacteria bacterium]